MDRRGPPPPQLPAPLAFAPVRRRRTPRYPIVVPAPAAPSLALSATTHQIPDPPAAAEAAEDFGDLRLLVDTALSRADAEAEAKAASSHPAPPPPPSPVGKKLRFSPPLPPAAAAADEEKEKRYAPPPLPPLAVDEPQSSLSMGHGDAAAKGISAAQNCKKAAAFPQGDAGSSKGDQGGGGVASPAVGASLLPQPGNDEYELEPGEIPPEKPAASCNAGSAHESLPGKDEEMAGAGEEEANKTIAAGEPAAATGSRDAHRAPAAVVSGAGVVLGRGDNNKAPADLSAAEQKRMKEVFVGGLCRDATEVDVWSALSAFGEITEVRMIRDRTHYRNNMGYCFVAYRDAAMASKAVAEFAKVKICGKPCRVQIPEADEKASNKLAQRDPTVEDYYKRIYEQSQPSPTLAAHSFYMTSWDPRHARYQNNTYAIPDAIPASRISQILSYTMSPVVATPSGCYIRMYHNGSGVYLPSPDLNHGRTRQQSGISQMGQSGSSRAAEQPHRRRN